MVQIAASYGITLLLVPADTANVAGATGSPSFCMTMVRDNGATACNNFGQFLANRYKAYKNIIWMLGNDYESDNLSGGSDDQYVAGIANGILTVTPNALITAEITAGVGTSAYSNQGGTTWTSILKLDQGYPGTVDPMYPTMVSAQASSPTMPVFFGEGYYDGSGGGTANQLRRQAWWTMVAGCFGYVYGHLQVYGFTSGWQSDLATTPVSQLEQWKAIWSSIAWQKLNPDTGGTFLASGAGSGTTKALAAFSSDGTLGVVYNPSTSANSITLSYSSFGSSPTVTAVDPTNGARTSLGSTTTPTMGNNAAGDPDWLFVVTASAASHATVTAGDTLSPFSETATRAAQASSRTAADTLASITDSPTRAAQTATRTAGDTLATITDTATRAAQAVVRASADTLGALSDTATRATTAAVRTAADTLTSLTDTPTRAAQSTVRTAADSLGSISDTPTRSAQHPVRTAADTLASFSESAAQAGAVRATDTLAALTETATRAAQTPTRTAADSLAALTDTPGRQTNQLRAGADTLAQLSDTPTRSAQHPTRTAGDSLSQVSELARTGATNFAADTLGALTELVNRSQGALRTAADTLAGLTDTPTRAPATIHRHGTDALAALQEAASDEPLFSPGTVTPTSGAVYTVTPSSQAVWTVTPTSS